jgi:hypothetical protein
MLIYSILAFHADARQFSQPGVEKYFAMNFPLNFQKLYSLDTSCAS